MDGSEQQGIGMSPPPSCHLCSKTYQKVSLLKTHYARAHFFDALRERYVGDVPLNVGDATVTDGDRESAPLLPTCTLCPFR
jgi:hypothetical protein